MMLEKTRCIVLHQIKYTDTGIVAHLYTRRFGRQSVLVRGMRKKKSGKHGIMFQPMFILEAEMYYKSSREMQSLKEFSVFYPPYSIYADIRKSSVAIFLGEVLASVLREETANEEMYDFIENSIIWFDGCSENYSNFHISFLSRLSALLGFEPLARNSSSHRYFDMRNGYFTPSVPDHGDYIPGTAAEMLSAFMTLNIEEASRLPLTGSLRNEILDSIIRYYSLHLPSLKKIRSLDVLREVFG